MSAVLFNTHDTTDGHQLIEVVLNAERALNALTLEMIELLSPALDAWAADERVCAVVLSGAGEKAFCAGGDVVSLYHRIKAGDREAPQRYFEAEYRLDYQLHQFPKPLICWADGIVMGGGMGLMNGCGVRVVTERSALSMPEVTIGLFPDVGGSWFLNRLPGRTGLFLALTGNPINPADALYLGLADRFIEHSRYGEMLAALKAANWSGLSANSVVSEIVRGLETVSEPMLNPHSPIRDHYDLIQAITDHDNVPEIVGALLATESNDNWIERAQTAVRQGSPLSIWIIERQLRICRQLSLRECFAAELNLAVQCGLHAEFPEGVRALLVDKDRKPEWSYRSVVEVDQACVDQFFEPLWPTNPMRELPMPPGVPV
ncbi:enoyl-CoA hydratase [Marinobacterium zhoushanense]|uniref:3-hydroxyisobutyryl-CoA hydrolase n=1 Tax=Marinobacterium zhoushanense TaxID=1679163 RepID=A0ABQ1KGR9_9GAMM|nr:enoyl-CoA hydratase/isomerase family protein [Marinobacterium zhoushanense]GGB97017.1 enoyl-CoA hydratase [Marinobacterium zhoushanense]